MLKSINPQQISTPSSCASHGLEVSASSRLLFLSGQVGAGPDGIVSGFEAQTARAFERIGYILADAGMTSKNVVKINAFSTVTGPEVLIAYRQLKDDWLAGHPAASTFVVVSALAVPDLMIEIDVIAAADS
jgi:enamine deaminase RidA (YjgF/YER057c/UK114 family)